MYFDRRYRLQFKEYGRNPLKYIVSYTIRRIEEMFRRNLRISRSTVVHFADSLQEGPQCPVFPTTYHGLEIQLFLCLYLRHI
jgi:hypothetical protein